MCELMQSAKGDGVMIRNATGKDMEWGVILTGRCIIWHGLLKSKTR